MNSRQTMPWSRVFLLLILTTVSSTSLVHAQTTAFTYQGRFTDGGTAANGTYDMQFKLFDGSGNQVGSTITNAAVTVSGGVFTVQLDYGASAFSGAIRGLEIGVRLAGTGEAYTVLSPRQQLMSTPYAIRAGAATTADTATNASQLGGVVAGQYVQIGDSRLTDARSPSAGSSNYIQNTTTQQGASNFNISGAGAADRFVATTQYNLGGARVLANPGFQNLFAGTNAGVENSSGQGDSFFGSSAGESNTSGSNNSFFGSSSGKNTTTGHSNSFFGASAGAASTGSYNSFFGDSAGAMTTGGLNSFFGTFAGKNNTLGVENSFVGHEAGYENTIGYYNSFLGKASGKSNISGAFNTFVGREAGFYNTTGVGNTYVGNRSGFDGGTGHYNTGIGYITKTENVSNATAIGANAQVTKDNSLVLGSINGVNLATADTNVGIGTTSPSFRLTVKTPTSSYGMVHTDGTITVGTYVGGAGNGGYIGTRSNHPLHFFANDGSASMTVQAGGNVGIGTTTPKAKLEVRGGNLFIANPSSLIMTSPNGACWFIGVSNTGVLSTVSIACP